MSASRIVVLVMMVAVLVVAFLELRPRWARDRSYDALDAKYVELEKEGSRIPRSEVETYFSGSFERQDDGDAGETVKWKGLFSTYAIQIKYQDDRVTGIAYGNADDQKGTGDPGGGNDQEGVMYGDSKVSKLDAQALLRSNQSWAAIERAKRIALKRPDKLLQRSDFENDLAEGYTCESDREGSDVFIWAGDETRFGIRVIYTDEDGNPAPDAYDFKNEDLGPREDRE